MALQPDIWLSRLRLVFEFVLTIVVLSGSYFLASDARSNAMADSGAAALAALVIGYWFGRGQRN